MPTVDSACTTMTLKILPEYFKAIQEGRKTADVRQLDSKWQTILATVECLEFVCGDKRILAIKDYVVGLGWPVKPVETMRALFGDIPWDDDTPVYLIYFHVDKYETLA